MQTLQTVTPFDSLTQIAGGYCVSRCLHVAANLGVADVLDDTPRSASDLASGTGAHPDALSRVLRLLAAHGIFEQRDGLYSHTPASRLLRTDHPQSMRSLVRMFGLPGMWATMGEVEHSVRTGLPAADKALGGLWSYFAADADAGRTFGEAMTAKAYGQVAGVIGAYDFSPFRVVGDIGGGRGHLLNAVLASTPGTRGVLFDLPRVVEDAPGLASDRLALQPGNFFTDDLPVCDVYLLMEVIHDWDDADSTRILRAVRRATPERATVLLIESIIPDDPNPDWSKMLDLWMLTIGGRQRTQREYAALLADAGFQFERQIDTDSNVSIIEAVRAG